MVLQLIARNVCLDPLPQNADLYSALVMLPKNLGTEADAGDDTPDDIVEKQLSGKQIGRMKAKKAVAARKETMTVVEGSDRDLKRLKSENP